MKTHTKTQRPRGLVPFSWLAWCFLALGCPKPIAPESLPKAPEVSAEVKALQGVSQKIIDATLAENRAYARLAELCDGVGHRLSGSPGLEKAIEWAKKAFAEDGQSAIRAEPVSVRRWVRGNESLSMLSPREESLVMLGLGNSVGTPAAGITGEVVSVRDEKEIEALGDSAKGKILLFNNAMPPYDEKTGTHYGEAVRFRFGGAMIGAKLGATAVLVRSVTARSLRSPHTGATSYRGLAEGLPKLPAAAVSVEDAEMLDRLYRAGKRPTVRLMMEAHDEGEVPSANVVAEFRGREKPDEIVLLGAHLDSWDVGQGAHDDGAGVVIVMEALAQLRRLGLQPKRTIRVVLYTNEENGLAGGRQYAIDHAAELPKHVAAIEADIGGFRPVGLSVDFPEKTPEAEQAKVKARLTEVLSLVAPLKATRLDTGDSGADIGPMLGKGPLLMGFQVDTATYFDYHHTHADTLDKVNPQELSQCVAAMAVFAYALAEVL